MSYTLLETVNYVISQTGAAPVDDISDPLPDVATALLRINEARIETIKRGLWFNSIQETIEGEFGGKFPIPLNTIKVTRSAPHFVVPRDGFLYSPNTGSDEFIGTPEMRVDYVVDVAYEDLPYSVQDVIRISAARQHVLHELEDDAKADSITSDLTVAVAAMKADDIEIRRFNLESNPAPYADEERKKLLAEGWWFNTEYGATITKGVDNKFVVSPNILKVLKASPGFLVERDGFLYDLNTQTDVFPDAAVTTVTLDRVVDLEITSCPQVVRDLVRLRADREERMKELIRISLNGDPATIEQGGARITGIQDDIRITYEVLRKEDQEFKRFNLAEGESNRQNEERIKVLKRGWWFNTEFGMTITKDGNDRYPVPEDTLKVLRTYPQMLVERNGFLYSTYENTDVFPDQDAEVCVDIIVDVPFAQLPASVQDVVRISCEREYTLNELQDLNKVQLLDADLYTATLEMNKDEYQLRKHTLMSNPGVIRMRGSVRPYRSAGRTINPNYPGGSF